MLGIVNVMMGRAQSVRVRRVRERLGMGRKHDVPGEWAIYAMTQPLWLPEVPVDSASMRISSTEGSSTGTGEAMVKNASIAVIAAMMREERGAESCQARRLGLG